MAENRFPRPTMTEAEAWLHAIGQAVVSGVDAERAGHIADTAASSVRRAHQIADLFDFLEAPHG